MSSNLVGVLTNHSNGFIEPLFNVDSKTDVSIKNKTEVMGTVSGLDIKGINTLAMDVSTGKGTITNEVVAGKGGSGIFMSKKVTSDGTQTDVGLKASVTTPAVGRTIFTVSARAGVTIDEDRNK